MLLFALDVVKTRMQKQVIHAGKEPKVNVFYCKFGYHNQPGLASLTYLMSLKTVQKSVPVVCCDSKRGRNQGIMERNYSSSTAYHAGAGYYIHDI